MRKRILILWLGLAVFLAVVSLAIAWRRTGGRGRAQDPTAVARPVPRRTVDPLPEAAVLAPAREQREPLAPALAPTSGDATPPSAPESVPALIVAVRDALGSTLEGASVVSIDGDAWQSFGATGADGTLALLPSPSWTNEAFLSVSKPSFATAKVDVGSAVDRRVEVVLRPAGVLRGWVSLPNGQRVSEGLTVVAMREGEQTLDLYAPRHAAMEVPGVHRASTLDDGGFTVEDCDPGCLYTVYAGGRGLASAAPARRAQPDGPPVEVLVTRVLAALVSVAAQDGAPLRGLEERFVRWRADLSAFDPTFELPLLDVHHAILAGLPPSIAAHADGPTSFLFVYGSNDGRDHAGPAHVDFELPGYERSRLEFELQALDLGLARFEFGLRRTTSGFAGVRVHVSGGLAIERMPSTFWPALWLRLHSTDEQAVLEYSLPAIPDTELVLEDVPFGTYDVVLQFSHGLCRQHLSREDRIRVDGGDEAQIRVDLSPTGAVEVDLRAPDGGAYSDGARVRLRDVSREHGGSGAVTFDRRPYLVLGLQPGRYEVSVEHPIWPGAPQGLSASEPVLVEAGKRASVRLEGSE